MSKAIRSFGPSTPDPDTVLETWVAGDGKRHRLRFDEHASELVVEDSTGYRDIGYVWDVCPWGAFHIPDFNSASNVPSTPTTSETDHA